MCEEGSEGARNKELEEMRSWEKKGVDKSRKNLKEKKIKEKKVHRINMMG